MKKLDDIVPSLGKCPNCGCGEFDINTNTCPECEYGILNVSNDIYNLFIQDNFYEQEKKKNITSKETVKKRKKIEYKQYKSYELEIKDNKITAIKYYFMGKKYLVYLNYKIEKSEVEEKSFYLPKTSEEYLHTYINYYITDLKIEAIFPKEAVGYGPKIYLNKNKQNELKEFILYVIKKFHKID